MVSNHDFNLKLLIHCILSCFIFKDLWSSICIAYSRAYWGWTKSSLTRWNVANTCHFNSCDIYHIIGLLAWMFSISGYLRMLSWKLKNATFCRTQIPAAVLALMHCSFMRCLDVNNFCWNTLIRVSVDEKWPFLNISDSFHEIQKKANWLPVAPLLYPNRLVGFFSDSKLLDYWRASNHVRCWQFLEVLLVGAVWKLLRWRQANDIATGTATSGSMPRGEGMCKD